MTEPGPQRQQPGDDTDEHQGDKQEPEQVTVPGTDARGPARAGLQVALQCSYLLSWISYLVHQTKFREAGRALFDVVYDRWSRLPQDQRPRLYVAGEGLGSIGGETASAVSTTFATGPRGPSSPDRPTSTLFREFSDQRDAGSPEAQPVYKNGRTVRFASDPAATFWQITADLPFSTGVPGATATSTRPSRSTGGLP